MKSKLIVRNKRAFSKCFVFNEVSIELGEDLLKRDNFRKKISKLIALEPIPFLLNMNINDEEKRRILFF